LTKPRSWSLSAYKMFEACPRKYKYVKLEKRKEPTHPAAARGTAIHLKAEYFLKGEITGMPDELKAFSKELRALRKREALAEQKLAVDMDWKPIGFKSRAAWLRGVVDAMDKDENEIVIIDFKTGRFYEGHAEQAEIYAVMAHHHLPQFENFHTEFWYLDTNKVALPVREWEFHADQMEELTAKWHERGMKVSTAKRFPANPGGACKWCAFRSDKGGPCHAWKKA